MSVKINLDHEALHLLLGEAHTPGVGPWPVPGTWPRSPEGWPVDRVGRTVHVMSEPAGGEVRGYVLCEETRTLHLRSPCYTGQWPLADALAEKALDARVAPYRINAGGMVEPAPTIPDDEGQLVMFGG